MSLKNALQDTTQASHAARRNTTHQLGGTVLIRLEMSICFLTLWLLQRHDEESWLLISLAEPLLPCRTECFMLRGMKTWENKPKTLITKHLAQAEDSGPLCATQGLQTQ